MGNKGCLVEKASHILSERISPPSPPHNSKYTSKTSSKIKPERFPSVLEVMRFDTLLILFSQVIFSASGFSNHCLCSATSSEAILDAAKIEEMKIQPKRRSESLLCTTCKVLHFSSSFDWINDTHPQSNFRYITEPSLNFRGA